MDMTLVLCTVLLTCFDAPKGAVVLKVGRTEASTSFWESDLEGVLRVSNICPVCRGRFCPKSLRVIDDASGVESTNAIDEASFVTADRDGECSCGERFSILVELGTNDYRERSKGHVQGERSWYILPSTLTGVRPR